MDYQDVLRERIKELECLYDISSLVSKSNEIAPVIEKICLRVGKAFQFPDLIAVRIKIGEDCYGYDSPFNPHREISQNIIFQDDVIGNIQVGYVGVEMDKNSFLIEEKKLLIKIAQEISYLYEREQRDKNEEMLNEIVRHQERLSILGEMTAGVAHELNTPLGNVIGFAEFILDSSQEKNTIRDARKIRQSALHAREIVKKLMLFSCNIPQKLGSENVKMMLDEALDLLTPVLKQNKINVNVFNNCPESMVQIDKVHFIQVLFNLLTNSIQASQTNSDIDVTITDLNGYVNISIRDYGVGIPIEVQDKIFNPFFTYNKQDKGNGLGLSVVHGIIKQHKGRIQFSSEPNKGTSFAVSIPKKS